MAFLDAKSFPTIGYFFKTLIFQNFQGRVVRRLPQDAVLASTVPSKK